MWWQRLWQKIRRQPMTLGRRGEQVAADYLKARGYRILARNWRCRIGEIDLLAQAPNSRTIVVVEVKTASRHDARLQPELHVNTAKQRKLSQLASLLSRQPPYRDRPIRFDVVGIDLLPAAAPHIRHHPGAFESTI